MKSLVIQLSEAVQMVNQIENVDRRSIRAAAQTPKEPIVIAPNSSTVYPVIDGVLEREFLFTKGTWVLGWDDWQRTLVTAILLRVELLRNMSEQVFNLRKEFRIMLVAAHGIAPLHDLNF